MPFIDLNGLNRFLTNVKTLIDSKISSINTPSPWRYSYNSTDDVLGLERDIETKTVTKCVLPYEVSADGITDEENAYHDTTNETYATIPVSTEEITSKIFIDTQIPQTVSNASISFKVGTSNISQSVWEKRSYVVKCGNTTLASGDFPLRTLGTVITATGTITSPIVEIDITAKTTVEQNVRIFGAQVDMTYTSSKEWVTIMRKNKLAK